MAVSSAQYVRAFSFSLLTVCGLLWKVLFRLLSAVLVSCSVVVTEFFLKVGVDFSFGEEVA